MLKNIIMIIFSISLAACSLLLPSEKTTIPLGNNDFFTIEKCTTVSIKKLAITQYNWITDITKSDQKTGIIETGEFDIENRIGFRLKIEKNTQNITIYLKGYGPYFNDLGAAKALADFKTLFIKCLN